MVPIHDTDVAAERWSQSEWENYELWEKVELRFKRKRRIWILSTLIVFLALSAVPIVMDRWPKWTTRSLSRQLAQEINRIKKDAIIDQSAYRIRFLTEGNLGFVVEKLENCKSTKIEPVRSGIFEKKMGSESYTWVSLHMGEELGVPGLVGDFCYDAYLGSSSVLTGDSVVGFGIIPVKDLAEKKIDRLSVLLLSGSSGEISFD